MNYLTLALTTSVTLNPFTRWSLNLLGIIASVIIGAIVLIYVLNKIAAKKRYAAMQQKLAAGELRQPVDLSTITDGANRPRFTNSDGDGAIPRDRPSSIAR